MTTAKSKLLIVDDDPKYAKLFHLISDRLGIEVHIVSSCMDAVKALKHSTFDLILMDWVMPDIDGPTCTGRIRAMQQDKERGMIPIIGVSGYVKATREKCIDAQMDDFLCVPFTIEELQEKLSYWLAEGTRRQGNKRSKD